MGVDTIAAGDDHIEVVEIYLVIDYTANATVYDACKFCTRRVFGEFAIVVNTFDVATDGRTIALKQLCQLFFEKWIVRTIKETKIIQCTLTTKSVYTDEEFSVH